jgi:hypothetical protein
MKQVTIHRCSECTTLHRKAEELATELRRQPDIQVEIVDGAKGEFNIEVEGQRVTSEAEFPTGNEVLAVVRGQAKTPQVVGK